LLFLGQAGDRRQNETDRQADREQKTTHDENPQGDNLNGDPAIPRPAAAINAKTPAALAFAAPCL